MYNHILVPTDGLELSSHAVESTSALADAVEAKITVLTVSIPYYEFTAEPEFATSGIEDYEKATTKAAVHCLRCSKRCCCCGGRIMRDGPI